MDTQTLLIVIQGVGLFITIMKGHVKTREDIAALKALITRCPHVKVSKGESQDNGALLAGTSNI